MKIPSFLLLSIPFADFPLQLSSLPFSLENLPVFRLHSCLVCIPHRFFETKRCGKYRHVINFLLVWNLRFLRSDFTRI